MALAPFRLRWFEEPTDPLDYELLAEVAGEYAPPLERRGWGRKSVLPHGGNQMTLAIVGGFGLGGCEAYPSVFGVFAGFGDDAKIEDGFIRLPDRPGIGFEGQRRLYEIMRRLTDGA